MLAECKGKLEWLDKIYDHASEVNICDYSSEIHKQNYAIHLMWLNTFVETYLFPSETVYELELKYLNQILRWSVLNPKARIVLWYDAAMVRPDSLQKTMDLFENLKSKQNNVLGEIQFRNIQELIFMQKLTTEQRKALYNGFIFA